MFIDILLPFCAQTGYHPVNDRVVAANLINRAAKEIYDGLEADDALSEVVLVVPRDLQLTLPYYINAIRGIREYKYSGLIPLQSIGQPQYSSNTWQFLWRNWRLKGEIAIHTSLNNAGVLTLTTPVVETIPAVVSIGMQTLNSSRIVEQVTMDAINKITTNSPVNILSISSATKGRIYDITISDINGNPVSVLYNAQSKTNYRIIDVSQYQWGSCFTGNSDTLAEVLFKPTLLPFYNDTDEFIALGFDDAIQYKALEFFLYGKEGKEPEVLAYNRKSSQATDLATRSKESGENKQISFQPNPVYAAFRRASTSRWISGYAGWGVGCCNGGFAPGNQ